MYPKKIIFIYGVLYVFMILLCIKEILTLSMQGFSVPGLSFAFGIATYAGFWGLRALIEKHKNTDPTD